MVAAALVVMDVFMFFLIGVLSMMAGFSPLGSLGIAVLYSVCGAISIVARRKEIKQALDEFDSRLKKV